MQTGSGFGYKISWLAVHGQHVDTVAAALGLGPLTHAPWPDAVERAYAGGWLLTPPVDGWTLVASRSLDAPGDSKFVEWLAALSSSLGDVHYYCTNRVAEYHAWARASGGIVQRAFGYYAMEAVFEAGERTADELSLNVGWIPTEEEWESIDEEDAAADPIPDEEDVFTMAGRWSVDPRTLQGAPLGLPWVAGPDA